MRFRSRTLAPCALLAATLLGCTSVPPQGGMEQVRTLASARIGTQAAFTAHGPVEQHIAPLLAQPLSVDDAVTIALLNNRKLQASYAALGIAQAELVQAGRLANPVFSFSRVTGTDGVDIERKLLLPILGLLTMPLTRELEQRRFTQAQYRTAAEVVKLADATRRAWFAAVAAEQSAGYMEQVRSAAQASAELAQGMAKAGNWSTLQAARERAFLADSVAQLARARQASVVERERLQRAMADSEASAMSNRLDLLMAQQELAGLQSSLGLSRATRWVNLLDLSYLRNSGAGDRSSGYEVALQIPLFDGGGASLARAEASYQQAAHHAAAMAVDARSEVRVAWQGYRSAWDLARHYRDEVLPLKKKISDEQLLRYNGMLISVFELLADAREQVHSVNAAIEAQRDYWIADAALQAALTGAGAPPP